MTVNDHAGTARQFTASVEAFSTNWITGTKVWGATYTVFFVLFVGFIALTVVGPSFGVHVHIPRNSGLVFLAVLGVMTVVVAIGGVYVYQRSRRKLVLSVSGDALTVGSRAELYSLADAQLGIWTKNGVALHLRSGGRRFTLGGQERRVGPATPLDAPPTPLVDARLPASDFDELLRLGGRSAARGPVPGEPSRCVAFPNSVSMEQLGPFALRKKQKLVGALDTPQVFIDIDGDSIRLVDPNSNAVNASGTVAQTTAAPVTYQRPVDDSGHFGLSPVMTLSVPGSAPLTIGCDGFAWSVNVPVTGNPPTYLVSAADWLELVDKLGLAADLADTSRKG
jgi:hypothetical protein